MSHEILPRATPCGSCPYRKDCPSGVWDAEEYAKLINYDAPTYDQPLGVFMCHSERDDKTMCRGWLDTHDKEHSLALRMAIVTGELTADIFSLPKSPVPVFESGEAAAEHGMADIDNPSTEAVAMIRKLERRINADPDD